MCAAVDERVIFEVLVEAARHGLDRHERRFEPRAAERHEVRALLEVLARGALVAVHQAKRPQQVVEGKAAAQELDRPVEHGALPHAKRDARQVEAREVRRLEIFEQAFEVSEL